MSKRSYRYPDSAPRLLAPTAHSAVWPPPRISASDSNAPLSSPVTSPVGLSSSPTSSPAGPSVPSFSRFSQVDGEELDLESEEITEAAREAKELIERARAAISIAPANPVQPLDSYEPIRFEDIDVDVDETPIALQLNTMFGGFDANPDDDEDEEALDIDDDGELFRIPGGIHGAYPSVTSAFQELADDNTYGCCAAHRIQSQGRWKEGPESEP